MPARAPSAGNVELSRTDKLFPAGKITKGDVIGYYRQAARPAAGTRACPWRLTGGRAHQAGKRGNVTGMPGKLPYLVLMGICLTLFVLAWALVWRYSVVAAVVMAARKWCAFRRQYPHNGYQSDYSCGLPSRGVPSRWRPVPMKAARRNTAR